MSILITGTGTDVGKTMVSSLILAKYGNSLDMNYWKPIQTGKDADSKIVQKLTGISEMKIKAPIYHFLFPASPHYSAFLEMEKIDTSLIVDELLKVKNKNFIIEGIGGALVPLSNSELFADVFSRAGLPYLIVCNSGLGTINHTLLTIEALNKRSGKILGFFIYGEENELLENNISTIENFSNIACLGKIFVSGDISDMNSFKKFTMEHFDKTESLKKAIFG